MLGSGLSALIHLDDAKRQPLNQLAINHDVDRVNASSRESEALKSDDEMTGEKGHVLGHLHRHCSLDRHLFVNRLPVLINDADVELMVTRVLGSKAEAHRERALGMHDRSCLGSKGIKGSGDYHFALIFSGKVTESCNLKVHNVFRKKTCPAGTITS